jgi:hypothetical protein
MVAVTLMPYVAILLARVPVVVQVAIVVMVPSSADPNKLGVLMSMNVLLVMVVVVQPLHVSIPLVLVAAMLAGLHRAKMVHSVITLVLAIPALVYLVTAVWIVKF